ncbi:type II toxin-antitoxin system HipA family toxin [Corallococcus carmarthensis]|uniref:type II toxin-antitoxin system HipA family toxin n=1 Tax=Corallococcus carmarthensis TaxID=2316728 RepID=UPI00148BF7FD|nr:type II toxin-antitoxin system HipA family toxin [Corallococcus carmarthensis]NOK20978.1 type II toxin-antitoxin system HipA family toxin [Corallococcus carmarthensis]
MATSDPSGCYVYLQLPASLDVVTCGRYVQQDGVGQFVYGRSYLANPRAVALDPFELPLREGVFTTAKLGGIFGPLRDASPDAWGRRVIERQLGRGDLTEVGFLLNSPEDRAGALSFGESTTPPAPLHQFNKVLQLRQLLEEANRVEQGLPPSPQVNTLVQPGSSMGGARPKNVVEDDDGLWIAKFPSRSDRWNNAVVEHGMLELARECGLRAASGKLLRVAGQDVLLVRRFDRERTGPDYLRHRMVSALTVLRADEDPGAGPRERSSWSYLLLADELKRWVRDPDEDLRELFSRMVFNALISNIDDHPRNHALIAPDAHWKLSPAYDLTPAPQASTERDLAMEVGSAQHRRANRRNLLSECARFRLSRDEATRIIDEMKARVSFRWRDVVRGSGGSETDLKAIERAFDYEGFEYGTEP